MRVKATYVSVWDGQEVRTDCEVEINTVPLSVFNVQTVENSQDWSCLEREFIELECGHQIDNFWIADEDNYIVRDGERLAWGEEL